jgi:hypothetical protein
VTITTQRRNSSVLFRVASTRGGPSSARAALRDVVPMGSKVSGEIPETDIGTSPQSSAR